MNIFRKKNFLMFVSALLLAVSGAVCASCGDDDEAASTSFDASAFAGFWTVPVNTPTNGTTDLHLLMYPDGHLVYYTTDINSKRTGTWSYNASQNVLATSISLGGSTLQWKIESTGSGWWSGVEQGDDGYLANTARKGNAEDFARLILNDLTWDNTDKSSTVYSFRVQWSDTYHKLVASSLVHKSGKNETAEDFVWIEYTKDGISKLDDLDYTFTNTIEQNYSFTSTITDDYQTLSLTSSTAKITVSNPLSYNTNAINMTVEFDKFILKLIEGFTDSAPGAVGTIGGVAVVDKFKGEFTVSK